MTDTPKDSAETKRSALVVTTLSSFLTPLSLSTVNVALPSMGRELAMDAVGLSWVASAYILTAAMFLVPFGRAADIYGRKRLFLVGMVIFTLASLGLSLSFSSRAVIALRGVQGLGSAMVFGTSIAILTSVYPPGERGRVLGINVASVYLGLSFGPFVGGLLTQYAGWRSVFLVNVPLGLAVAVVTVLQLRGEWAEARGEPFDLFGSAIYGAALLLIMLGFSSLPSFSGAGLVGAGLLGVAVFVVWERKARYPVLDTSLFLDNRVFALSNVAALISYSATFAVGFLVSLYLQLIKGYTPRGAGLILVIQPIVQAALSPLAGRASDTVEPRVVASAGMAVTAAGLFLLAGVEGTTSQWSLMAALALLGAGFAGFSSPNSNAIMGSVERRHYTIASATLATMRVLGQMFSMAMAMLIFGLYLGGVEIAVAGRFPLLKSIKTALFVFGVLCLAGTFASLARGRMRGG